MSRKGVNRAIMVEWKEVAKATIPGLKWWWIVMVLQASSDG